MRPICTWTAIEQLVQDLRHGFRVFRTAPALSATVVLLVSLVVGGNAAIFSIVHGIFSKPASGVSDAPGLVRLRFTSESGRRGPDDCCDTYQNARTFIDSSAAIRPLAASRLEQVVLTTPEGSYSVIAGLVSRNFFETLGVRPAIGSSLSTAPDNTPSVVISARVWSEQFDARPDVAGQILFVNGRSATIVGVAPPRFHGPFFANFADAWMPIDGANAPLSIATDSADRAVELIGRLASNTSIEQAQAEIDRLAEQRLVTDPQQRKMRVGVISYSPIPSGIGLAMARPWLMSLLVIVTLTTVLLVCANLANLMLARALGRQREFALRQSLGAGRVRVVRMLAAEALALSTMASVGGLLFTWATAKLCAASIPPVANLDVDFAGLFAPDWTVAVYVLALVAAGTSAFTIGPVVMAWKQELLVWLRNGEQTVAPGRGRLAGAFLVVQLACALLLLTGSGLLVRSINSASHFSFGFDDTRIIRATVSTAAAAESPETRRVLLRVIRDRLTDGPGAPAVSYTDVGWGNEVEIASGATGPVTAQELVVGPGFLRAFGLDPIEGRELDDSDITRGDRAVIARSLAEAISPGGRLVGQRLQLGDRRQVEVVGIAPDAYFTGIVRGPTPRFLFVAATQQAQQTTFFIRHSGSPSATAAAVGRLLKDVDPNVAIVRIETEWARDYLSGVVTTLIALFAIGSLVIATAGQYAVVAFALRKRRREFGVRIALGASLRQIVVPVVADWSRWTIAGAALGTLLSAAFAMGVRRALFGVQPLDPLTYIGALALLAAASLVACGLPAWRTARIDPVQILRED